MDNLPAFHDAFHIHIQQVHPAIAHGGDVHTWPRMTSLPLNIRRAQCLDWGGDTTVFVCE